MRLFLKLAFVYHPIVEGAMILEFERANRVRNAFHCVLYRVSEVV